MHDECGVIAWDWTDDIWSSMSNFRRSQNGRDPPTVVFLDISAGERSEGDEIFAFEGGALPNIRPKTGSGGRRSGDVSFDCIDLDVVDLCKHQDRGEATRMIRAAGLFLRNAASYSSIGLGERGGVHLLLRREIVEGALGGPMPSANSMAEAIVESHVAMFLREQLLLLAQVMATLTEEDNNFLLNQTARLALYTLKGMSMAPQRVLSTDSVRAELFDAAQDYIQRHFSNFNLDSNRIAKGIGASRATLYRAYADRGCTVADAIRKIRLKHAEEMLRAGPVTTSIDVIAETCGFSYSRSFQRAFRASYGLNPSNLRPRGR